MEVMHGESLYNIVGNRSLGFTVSTIIMMKGDLRKKRVGIYHSRKKMIKSIYNTLVIAPHAIDIFDKYLK